MRNSTLIISILLIANLALMTTLLFVSKTEAISAMEDPLNYGARKLIEANGKPVSCSCSLITNRPTPTLWFDGYNMTLAPPPRIINNKTIEIFNFTFNDIS